MSLAARLLENRRSVVSGSLVTLLGVGLVGLALWYDGEATADVELNDSGVWVTQTSSGTLGRFNVEARALDGTLLASSVSFDVQQHAQDVLLENSADWSASPVNPAQLALKGTASFPSGAQVETGGRSVAVHDGDTGSVWVLPFAGATSFDEGDTDPTLEVGTGGELAVGEDGTVFVAVPEDRTVHTIETSPQGTPGDTGEIDLPVSPDATVQVTVVGDEPVVLDRSTGTVHLPGGDEVELDGGAQAQLQQPSAGSDVVLLATPRGLVSQPLDGGAATTRSANGTPARPVQLGGCHYGAWSASGQVVRDCPGTDHDEDLVLEGIDDDTALVYRVNRDQIVLNDMVGGTLWMAADDFTKVDDWDLTIPENAEGDEAESEESTPEHVDQFVADRTEENRPPIAADDSVGVRPGRTTVLDVLGNDIDPDGDVMTVSVTDGPDGSLSVDRVLDGAALQADVPADASGDVTFSYQVDDGRENGTDTATVKVRVVPLSENEAPVQSGEPVLRVGQDGTATIKVLPSFRDPDGDDLFLSHASTSDPNDEVRFRPDGTVEFRDGGAASGRKIVDLTVSDAFGVPVEGRLLVDVEATNVPPIAVQDHVTVLAGETVTVDPLSNDSDPNGDTLRLVTVDERDGVQITPGAGVFKVLGEEPGSFDITYQVSDGPNSTTGLVRVDVVEPPASDAPPVAVSDELLLAADGTGLLDVLANDTDPAGGVLVVQSVTVPDDVPLDVAVLNHAVLKITQTKRLSEPVTFEYTVANGAGATTSQVRVVPIPAPEALRPPEAGSDEAIVHVGDVVTIDVLDNDTHPDGLSLTVDDALVEEPDAALGEAFVSEDTVRFKAGGEPGEAHLVYEVFDANGQKDSAQVTVTIVGGEENTAPQVPETSARVLAGRTVRVPLPLDGIDPDGDHVTVRAISGAPSQGRAAIVDGYIDYTAGERAAGLDTLTYEVVDTRGAVGQGTLRIGIVAPPATNEAPQVIDDATTVRPGRTVAIRALENDVDPDGDEIGLVGNGFEGVPDGIDPEVVDDDVVLTAPDTEGAFAFYYTAQDAYGARATGAITVTVDEEAPLLRPVATDDVVSADQVEGETSVTVDVLANDVDPDGVGADLEVSVDTPSDQVTVTQDGSVQVRLGERAQVVTYTVTDVDGLTANAFVRVPADQSRPYVRPGLDPLQATSGEPLTIDLAEYVVVRDGRTPRVTEESTVQGTDGAVEVTDHDTIVYTAHEDYAGAASVSFQVTDGDGPDDPDGLTAVLTLPVHVTPAENMPPQVVGVPLLEVAAGEEAAVDLARYVDDPEDDALTFEVSSAEGVTTSVSAGTVTAQADVSVAKGTVAEVPFTVSDGQNPAVDGVLAVTVVASTRPLVETSPDEVPDAHQGEPVSVPVLENDTNPFPGEARTLVGAYGETGDGQVSFDDDHVTVTPAADFHGVMTVRYTVEDATADPDRQVDGLLTVTVLGRPEPPSAPDVLEVRSETVVLSWDQPNDNGAEITGYTVTADDGTSQDCATTTCTVEGLTNDQTYTFTVTASNVVGESDPSPPSEEARPDERPDAPEPPTLVFGDQALTVSWTNEPYTDRSPIECVNLEISPAPADGRIQKTCLTATEVVWEGLTNGTEYTVRVQAINGAPEPSDWSQPSAPETPAGPPLRPAAPTADRVDTAVGGQTKVSWTQPGLNGAPIETYYLDVYQGGELQRTVEVPGTRTTQTVQDLDTAVSYRFAIRAENKAGESEASALSAAVVAYGTPEPATGVQAALLSNTSGRAEVTWSKSADVRGPGPYYQVRANGAGAKNAGNKASYTYTGLTNGTAYTFQVRACNEFTCSAWSTKSGSVTPYTTPGAPGAAWQGIKNADGKVNDGSFRVTRPGNDGGRAVDTYEFRVSGGDAKSGTRDGSAAPFSIGVAAGFDKTYTFEVRARNAAGWGAWKTVKGSTYSPTPSATVSRGSGTGYVDGCSSGNCNYMKVTVKDFYPSGETHRVECWSYNNPQSDAGWHNIRMSGDKVWTTPGGPGYTMSLPANGTVQLDCFYGHPGTQVAVVIDDKRYAATTW
jgi:hypothetical protein